MGLGHFMGHVHHKLKQGLDVANTLKGLYDVGKTVYSVGRVVAPIVGALL